MRLTLIKLFLFLLLLIVVGFLFYSVSALATFYKYDEAQQKLALLNEKTVPKLELTYGTFKLFFKNEFKKEKVKLTATIPINDQDSALKTFRFTLDQKDLDMLNEDLPTSGKDHDIQAYLLVSDEPDKIRKVKLRYRGDNTFHWLYPQKSLRIKLAKNDIYNMEKSFNLINPPYDYTFVDVLNYQISSSLGLIAPDFFPVRVFVNGRFMGVYMYLSQINESLVRKHKIMPGSIYFGDNAPPNKDGVSSLWFDSKYWDKKAARNAEQKNNRDDIDYFINSITNLNQLEFYNFVNNYLDKQKYYVFFALDVIFGSEHHDYHHNHKLYFDPYKGKFEPIQWDLRFWHPYGTKDVSVYPLIEKISLNPILEHQRDEVAYKLMKSDFFRQENIEKLLYKIADIQISDLKADRLKDRAIYDHEVLKGWYSEPYTIKDMNKTIKDKLWHYKVRQEKLTKIYENANIKYNLKMLSKGTYLLELISFGNSAVDVQLKNQTIALFRDSNFNRQQDANETQRVTQETLYPGRTIAQGTVEHFTKLLSGSIHIVPSDEYYPFIIKSNDTNITISDFIFTNKLTNEPVQPTKMDTLQENIKNDSIHPWKIPQLSLKEKLLQGEIHVTKTLVFDKETTVHIKPNTTFLFDANTSIYFYGKVEAIGTEQKPIKFIAKDPQKPWGLVAVQGKAASGSKFEYCEFENGSVDNHNLISYTAPFNLHDLDWFEVRNSKIGKNFMGDDAMHIAYSKGIVDNCFFKDARSDALDIDIADVIITNNTFSNSRNDGLDIMTTTMKASNNTFIDNGDKGASIGEWSDANITNSKFIRNNTALEIKDKSKVIADNLIFVDSKEKAINLYNKNKRYDSGGTLEANTLYFKGNANIKVDKHSHTNIKNIKEYTGD